MGENKSKHLKVEEMQIVKKNMKKQSISTITTSWYYFALNRLDKISFSAYLEQ